jgi:hypothetical protein
MFTKIEATTEDFSCPCCDATMPDFIAQDLEQHWDKPNLLYRDLRRWVEDGFARFAWPLHERLFYIEGPSERVTHARDAMIAQIQCSLTAQEQDSSRN